MRARACVVLIATAAVVVDAAVAAIVSILVFNSHAYWSSCCRCC